MKHTQKTTTRQQTQLEKHAHIKTNPLKSHQRSNTTKNTHKKNKTTKQYKTHNKHIHKQIAINKHKQHNNWNHTAHPINNAQHKTKQKHQNKTNNT